MKFNLDQFTLVIIYELVSFEIRTENINNECKFISSTGCAFMQETSELQQTNHNHNSELKQTAASGRTISELLNNNVIPEANLSTKFTPTIKLRFWIRQCPSRELKEFISGINNDFGR